MVMIKIDDLLPLMEKGWVAMDKNGEWWWFRDKPVFEGVNWQPYFNSDCHCLYELFDIAPADDWTKSLIRVKGND